MKREYTKPLIFAESFELAEHIAGPCANLGKANYRNAVDCSYDGGDPNGNYFVVGVTAKTCAQNPDIDVNIDDWYGYSMECYTNFDDDTAMFAS